MGRKIRILGVLVMFFVSFYYFIFSIGQLIRERHITCCSLTGPSHARVFKRAIINSASVTSAADRHDNL